MNYSLMHKDLVVSTFKLENNEVTEWILPNNALRLNHLPLPLKRIVHYINGGYIERENKTSFKVNEEGRYFLERWLHDRAIPITRENFDKYTKNSALGFMIDSHSLSLTDCYWTKQCTEDINWNAAKLFNSNKIDRLDIVNEQQQCGKRYSSVNSTLGGQLEKFWYYVYTKNGNKELKLAKKTSITNNILNIREVIASKIYDKQGYKNYCKYSYIRNRFNQVTGCKCKAFTCEQLELITVYDLLEEYGKTQSDNIYTEIVKLASNYGANVAEVVNQLDMQTLVDYLVTNRDRHQNNIGFLRDPDTLRIIKIAPIFDSGSCIELEGQLPLGLTNTTTHNLYNTELECLEHVKDINTLDLSKLPSNRWIEEQYKNMFNSNTYSIKFYMDLYNAKVDYLKKLQQERKTFK